MIALCSRGSRVMSTAFLVVVYSYCIYVTSTRQGGLTCISGVFTISLMKKRRVTKDDGSAVKGTNIIIRASVSEKAGFKAAASLSGQALSVWIRDRLRRAAREELEYGQKPVPFLEHP